MAKIVCLPRQGDCGMDDLLDRLSVLPTKTSPQNGMPVDQLLPSTNKIGDIQ